MPSSSLFFFTTVFISFLATIRWYNIIKVNNHIGLWDAELAWYSLSTILWICLMMLRRFWYLFVQYVVGGLWIVGFYWGDFEYCIWFLFLLFTLLTWGFLLSMENGKRIEDRRKATKILLYAKLYLGVHDYYVVERFPEPVEVIAFSRQGVEIY